MLKVSNNFKNDIVVSNQNLKSYIVIFNRDETSIDYLFSVDNESVDIIYKDLSEDILVPTSSLSKVSNVRISTDYDSKKLKINRLRCTLFNNYDVKYKLSRRIDDSVVGRNLSLYYKSPSTNIINLSDVENDADCVKIYNGLISRLKFNSSTIDISVEDRTQIKIANKSVPYYGVDRLDDDIKNNLLKNYNNTNTTVPMTFGRVGKAEVLPYIQNNNPNIMDILIDVQPTGGHFKTAKIPYLMENVPSGNNYYLYVKAGVDYVIYDHGELTTEHQGQLFSKFIVYTFGYDQITYILPEYQSGEDPQMNIGNWDITGYHQRLVTSAYVNPSGYISGTDVSNPFGTGAGWGEDSPMINQLGINYEDANYNEDSSGWNSLAEYPNTKRWYHSNDIITPPSVFYESGITEVNNWTNGKWLLLKLEEGLDNLLVNIKSEGTYIGNTWVASDWELRQSDDGTTPTLDADIPDAVTHQGCHVISLHKWLLDLTALFRDIIGGPNSGADVYSNYIYAINFIALASHANTVEDVLQDGSISGDSATLGNILSNFYYDNVNMYSDATMRLDINNSISQNASFYGSSSSYANNFGWQKPRGLYVGDWGHDGRKVVGPANECNDILVAELHPPHWDSYSDSFTQGIRMKEFGIVQSVKIDDLREHNIYASVVGRKNNYYTEQLDLDIDLGEAVTNDVDIPLSYYIKPDNELPSDQAFYETQLNNLVTMFKFPHTVEYYNRLTTQHPTLHDWNYNNVGNPIVECIYHQAYDSNGNYDPDANNTPFLMNNSQISHGDTGIAPFQEHFLNGWWADNGIWLPQMQTQFENTSISSNNIFLKNFTFVKDYLFKAFRNIIKTCGKSDLETSDHFNHQEWVVQNHNMVMTEDWVRGICRYLLEYVYQVDLTTPDSPYYTGSSEFMTGIFELYVNPGWPTGDLYMYTGAVDGQENQHPWGYQSIASTIDFLREYRWDSFGEMTTLDEFMNNFYVYVDDLVQAISISGRVARDGYGQGDAIDIIQNNVEGSWWYNTYWATGFYTSSLFEHLPEASGISYLEGQTLNIGLMETQLYEQALTSYEVPEQDVIEFNTDGIIDKPSDIVMNILTTEMEYGKYDPDNSQVMGVDILKPDYNQFDLDSIEESRIAHADWKMGFCINTKIDGKKLIENILKESKSFPRFTGDGKFGLITIKNSYTEDDIDKTINVADIIDYKVDQTRVEDIITSVKLFYRYDNGLNVYNNELEKTINDLLGGYSSEGFEGYNITELDTYKEMNLRYHTETETVNKFADFTLLNNCNVHLLMNLTLPLNYMEISVGDVIYVPLIEDEVFNIDYSRVSFLNSQPIYPLFIVMETNITSNNIKIKGYQLHYLGTDGDHGY